MSHAIELSASSYRSCPRGHEAMRPGEGDCRACPGMPLARGRCTCCGATWERDGTVWVLVDPGRLTRLTPEALRHEMRERDDTLQACGTRLAREASAMAEALSSLRSLP